MLAKEKPNTTVTKSFDKTSVRTIGSTVNLNNSFKNCRVIENAFHNYYPKFYDWYGIYLKLLISKFEV